MKNKYLILLLAILAAAALACNAAGLASDSESEEAEAGAASADQPAESSQPVESNQSSGEAAASQSQPAAQSPALPIGMRQGLASLNSYRIIMRMANNGPTALDISETRMEARYSADDDARYMRNENLESSSDYPDPYLSIEETYQVGLQSCGVSTYDAGTTEVVPSELTPLIRDMTLSTTNLFDINVTVENPTFTGSETINGVPSDHYTFQITGLGDYSGQEVTMADGEYWVAQDGRYLVKYFLALEVRSAPDGDPAAEVLHTEISYDLSEVNQPQSISMPPECLP